MTLKDVPRLTLLKIVAGLCGGLVFLDYVILEPAAHAWTAQGERIEALQHQVENGRKLLDRDKIIRGHWQDMQRANLSSDNSIAEGDVLNAVNRWKLASGVGLPSFIPQSVPHDDQGYDEIECRATATGDETAIGRFLYELETDPIPVNLEECEISTRDAHGQQLTLTARFSFAHLNNDSGGSSGSTTSNGRVVR